MESQKVVQVYYKNVAQNYTRNLQNRNKVTDGESKHVTREDGRREKIGRFRLTYIKHN